MTAYLDEGVPARLSSALARVGCRVLKFPVGWKGLRNGELLARLRREGGSCLITCERNLTYQQNVAASGVAIVVLPRQRFDDLRPLVADIGDAVARAEPGVVVMVGLDGASGKT